MKFLIISHVTHIKQNQKFYAYEPYVREINLWGNYVSEVLVVAPLVERLKSNIEAAYLHNNIKLQTIPKIEFTSIKSALYSIFKIPIIFVTIFNACKKTDHIHLRCPGNIGLLGCIVQIAFPSKSKSAKYAGNWDPNSKQPLSYRLQKWILSNTFLTRNMQVLVYGNWKNQTKNIKPFFTASFSKDEIEKITPRNYNKTLKFVFTGSLVSGKRPLLSIQIIEALNKKGIKSNLHIFGGGVLMKSLKLYVQDNNLNDIIFLKGNQEKDTIKEALKDSHFLILPSKSEGWPKAIAEAMFFGVIPISTKISCIEWMLDYGKRGILINPILEEAVQEIIYCLEKNSLKEIAIEAQKWSQKYTLDSLGYEIKKILQ
ncbi:MAG: glycosyltransferase [Flavobacteriaceae bacterium]|nr:glycosyltransferase [Flavobacteriaceae bacterium]